MSSRMVKQSNKLVKLDKLINFNSRSKDLTTGLKGEVFKLTPALTASSCYWHLALDICDHFSKLGMVNIGADIYGTKGCYAFMVNVYGRSPVTGQRYHVLF